MYGARLAGTMRPGWAPACFGMFAPAVPAGRSVLAHSRLSLALKVKYYAVLCSKESMG